MNEVNTMKSMTQPRRASPTPALRVGVAAALAAGLAAPSARAQSVTLQSDDGTMEQLWSLTSPNAGPGDWIGVAYTPPFEHPFRVVSASMFYLDSYCCDTFGDCSDSLCVGGDDWEERVITHANLAVDSAGLSPDLATPVALDLGIPMNAGSSAESPPWTMTPDVWTLPAGTVFDHPGRIFYAIKYFADDSWMRFAVDNSSANQGTSIYTSDNFSTRSAIWSFGNVGMRIVVEPIFSFKLSTQQPPASFRLRGDTGVPMLALRVAGGNASTTITRVRVTASGSGDDAAAISAVRLIVDSDGDGVEGTGEPTLASGTFLVNDGTVDLVISRTLAAGADERWLVVYDLDNTPAGGATFTARIAQASDIVSNLGAPHMSGTTTGAGAITGNTVTIAGRLVASRGPSSMSAQIVAAGETDVAPLQLRLTAENEAFTVTALALTASGTLNDLTSIPAVRLLRDVDSSGTVTAGDLQLSSAAYAADDGRITFPVGALTIPANGSRDLIVAYDLAGSAAGGQTFRAILAAATDVTASGTTSGALPATGPRALAGAPVIGELATIGGALAITAGAANPAAGTAQPGTAAVPMLQVQLTAQSEDVAISQLTFASTGSGDEALHVARAVLHRDTNGNGLRDAADVLVGLPQSFASDEGVVTFAMSGEVVPANASRLYLLTYDLAPTPTGGETFTARVSSATALIATGSASGATIVPAGAFPISGGTRTLLGGLSFALGPESPPPANHQPEASGVPVLQLQVAAQGERFDVSSVRLTAAGSMSDQSGVLSASLWRDSGTLGALDAADLLLASGAVSGDDGSLLFTPSPARSILPGVSERWLVTYALSATPSPGETFRLSLSSGADISATGTLSGAASPSGLPIGGSTQAIGGTLQLALAPLSPNGGTLHPGAADVVMLSARLAAILEPITVTSVTFTGSGTGNELTGVAAASLWVDTDRDGEVDPVGDVQLGAPRTFTANDGRLTFAIAPRTLAAGTSEDWLVAYSLGAAPAAGETFQLQLASDTDLTATAPSGPLPRASGAPITGGARTVLGNLVVSRGTMTPAAATVRRDATRAPVLQLVLGGAGESFLVSSLALHAAGSLDDAGDVTGVSLYLDADGNGAWGPADTLLSGPVPFTGDDGVVTLSGFSLSIPAGTSPALLATVDLAGSAPAGATFRLALPASSELTATGFGGRPASAIGLPISSETLRAGGTIDVSLGAATPLARVFQRNAAGVDALQLRFAPTNEAATITQLTLSAAGSGHDALGITSATLHLDANGNGRADANEVLLGTTTFTADDGTITFSPGQLVQIGPPVYLVVRLSFTAQPRGGDTFGLALSPVSGVQVTSSSGAVLVTGLPLQGSVLTAGGGFEVALSGTSSPGAAVNQAQQNVPVAALELTAVNEACTVEAITLRAAGSIDDHEDIAAARLLYDANDNGLVDFTDLSLGPPQVFGLDDGTITFAGLSRSFGADATQRWLVVYDLAGTASNLETFRLRLEREADLVVACAVSGAVTPLGAPLESGTFSIQEDGALVVSRSAQTPPSQFLEAGSVRAPLLGLRFAAEVRDASLERLTLRAVTSTSASAVIAGVELFRDLNQDGVLDRSDVAIATGSGPDPAGRVTFEPLGIGVPVAEPIHLLVTAGIARGAAPGTTILLALEADQDVGATSGLGLPLVTGAPIAGEQMTVAGHLNLRAAPGAPAVVKNNLANATALDLELSASWESFTLRGLTLTAEGTMDPATAVLGLSLVSDDDDDGAIGAQDRVLASGVTFPQGSKRTSIAGLSERIEATGSRRFLVGLDLAGTARARETLALGISANVDVVAAGDLAGVTSPIGAPVVGPTFTIGASLLVHASPRAPVDAVVAANAESVPALAFELEAANEDVTVSRISLSTSGSLDDAQGLASAHLLLDANQDGRVDPGDLEVGGPARAVGDDGSISFGPLAERLPRDTRASYLVTLDLSGAGAAGENVTLELASDADVSALGAISGAISAALDGVIRGGRVTLTGALSVLLGPASPAGGGVRAGSTFPALQLELVTRGEAVVADRLVLGLDGTADDAQVIERARLWRDLDGDGSVGDQDVVAGEGSPDGDDGTLSFENLGVMIGSDVAVRLLVELELGEAAPPGGTLRLSLRDNADLRATGSTSGELTAVGAPLTGSSFTVIRASVPVAPSGDVAEGCGCTTGAGGPPQTPGSSVLTLLALAAILGVARVGAPRLPRCRSIARRGASSPRGARA